MQSDTSRQTHGLPVRLWEQRRQSFVQLVRGFGQHLIGFGVTASGSHCPNRLGHDPVRLQKSPVDCGGTAFAGHVEVDQQSHTAGGQVALGEQAQSVLGHDEQRTRFLRAEPRLRFLRDLYFSCQVGARFPRSRQCPRGEHISGQ